MNVLSQINCRYRPGQFIVMSMKHSVHRIVARKLQSEAVFQYEKKKIFGN